jgi:two-component system response regulator RegX3
LFPARGEGVAAPPGCQPSNGVCSRQHCPSGNDLVTHDQSKPWLNVNDRPIRILVVEDEESYRDALATGLSREGYEVQLAPDGMEGLRLFTEDAPDLVLLDVMLPEVSGIEVCQRMQALLPAIPIIMLTALNTEVDVVLGLEVGAVDYLTKPYRLRELIARIQAVLRRVHPPALPTHEFHIPKRDQASGTQSVHVGPVTVDFMRREVRVDGRPVHLSRREFEVLAFLASPLGQVRTRDELIDRLWSNSDLSDTRTLDTHIRRLRTKIEPNPSEPRYLMTVRGVGFRLDPE